jgi:hypothetical protein
MQLSTQPSSIHPMPVQAAFPEPSGGLGGQAHPFLDKLQQIGDLDLTAAVRQVMAQSNIPQEHLIAYDSHPSIQRSVGKAPATQLYLQKEFWSYQLLALQENANISTLEDRLLVDRFMDPQTWLTYFTNNVMDLVVVYNMPVRHGW